MSSSAEQAAHLLDADRAASIDDGYRPVVPVPVLLTAEQMAAVDETWETL